MAEVRFLNVVKRFSTKSGDVLAVDQVNLEVADGEFLVLLGPSGCGKTTTLRMVAGLETATSGDIFIGSRRVNDLAPGERDIAFVFQFYALYPHLSVRDNIAFPLRAQRISREEVDKRVQDVAQRLKIEHILKRRPNRLPSGEQQRVALGRAMVRQPQVFLMDEPLTNLDASLRADMRVELKHLQHELGTTMLYVTHDQTEAMSMSHRIAVMNLGVLQQVGTPLEIYNHPQTLFVALFIGSPPMNMMTCTLSEGRHLQAKVGNLRLTLSSTHRLLSQEREQNVAFGVRSEDVHIQSADRASDVMGTVLVREPLGDETIYQVDVGGESALLVKALPREVFQPGERVGLTIDPERIHLFEAATGKSLLAAAEKAG
ncbi:MAG: ABC transporter ATP-binding protein [Chloroflexi bacterium]|nr:ABC transporter ATP-binding protein [Chloroflexota bacterium]